MNLSLSASASSSCMLTVRILLQSLCNFDMDSTSQQTSESAYTITNIKTTRLNPNVSTVIA